MPFLSSQSTCIQRNVVLIGAILFLVGCGGTEYRAKAAETGRNQLFLDGSDVIGRIEGLSEVTIYSTGLLAGSVRKVRLMKARSTGRSWWQGIQGNESETIEVSVGYGLKTSYIFIANFNSKSEANFSIDVAKLISQRLKESNDSEIIVSITCSCLWFGSQADATTENLKLRPTLNIQLTKAAYPSLFEKNGVSATSKSTEKALPKSSSQRDKADRCKKIGLSEGTNDFKLCLRSLK